LRAGHRQDCHMSTDAGASNYAKSKQAHTLSNKDKQEKPASRWCRQNLQAVIVANRAKIASINRLQLMPVAQF
jgi:hypothetical protein